MEIVKYENQEALNHSQPQSSRLGSCEVCAVNEAKYTCPKCEVKTCTIKCTKIHKDELQCDGQRDRTKFIPVNKFTNLDLLSDYRLLEEISRVVETSKKKFGPVDRFGLPHALQRLKNAARDRNTFLKLLPRHMVKRRKNKTNIKAGKIYWDIEWVFVHTENLKILESSVLETEKLCTVFSKYLVKQEDKHVQEQLKFYQAMDTSNMIFYLKAEQKPGNQFYELDPLMTIKECLARKIVIEYPSIYIVFKDSSSGYNVIDSDDEDSTDSKPNRSNGHAVINKILKSEEKQEQLNCKSKSKNLLFASDCSDESDNEKQPKIKKN